ncbi:hypothetical protein ACFL1N_14210 [Thermodesulfobacteriota bacterium]
MKFKIFLIYILIVLFSFIFTSGPSAGNGRITNVDDDGNMGNIIVEVRGSGTLWVGCTIYPNGRGKYYKDLEAKKVKGGGKVSFNVLPHMSYSRGSTSLEYVVALWEGKISLRKCEKKYGKNSDECISARRNGYQMEGRLDRREGTYKAGFD